MQMIALSRLKAGKQNPRTTKPAETMGFDELKASLLHHGLLQNLTVRASTSASYEVVIGNRRLAALKALAKEKAIDKDLEVPCQVTEQSDDEIREAAVSENLNRTDMAPLDASEAINKLVDNGASVADIAARFGRSETWVKQRQALAALIKPVKEALRAGNIGVGTACGMTALATDDQQALMDRFQGRPPEWAVAQQKRVNRLPASRALFDLGDYTQTAIIRDLFEDATWLTDIQAFDRLQRAAAERLADQYREDGWDWVEVREAHHFDAAMGYQREQPHIELPDEIYAQVEQLHQQLESAEAHEEWHLQSQINELYNEHGTEAFTEAQKASLGVFVCINPETREVRPIEGLQLPRGQREQPDYDPETGEIVDHDEPSTQSGKSSPDDIGRKHANQLNFQVGAHYLNVLSQDPHAMKAVLVYALSRTTFDHGLRVERRWVPGEIIDRLAEQSYEDLYGDAYDARQWETTFTNALDGVKDMSLLEIVALDSEQLDKLLAALGSKLIGPDSYNADSPYTSAIYRMLVGREPAFMRQWWCPDQAFLGRYTRAQLVALVRQLVNDDKAENVPQRKTDAVEYVARLFAYANDHKRPEGMGANTWRAASKRLNAWVPSALANLEADDATATQEAAE